MENHMALTRASQVTATATMSEGQLDLNELGREGAAVLITVKGFAEEKDYGNGIVKPIEARIVALTGSHAGEVDDDALIFKAGIRNKLHEVGQSVVGRLRPYGARKAIGLEAEEDGDVELAEKVLAQLDGPVIEAKAQITEEVAAAKQAVKTRKAAKVALGDDDEPPF